ncbi:MAG: hypothetical protein ACYC2G_11720 [Gemmatimonadaceae bacterium]
MTSISACSSSAILAGLLADLFGMGTAIGAVAALTAASGLLVVLRMPETPHVAAGADGAPPAEGS